jgi:transposase
MTSTVGSKQPHITSQVQPPVPRVVFGGVDTHQQTHMAAVVDADDQVLGEASFPVTGAGYRALAGWLAGHGHVVRVGVEGTGGYGSGLAQYLLTEGVTVIEVDRPDRSTRARDGKSDPIDAIAAARAVRTGRAQGIPKLKTGAVEALRMLTIPRDSAVKDRTRAYNQLRDLITTAPTDLHDELITLTGKQRVKRALSFRPDRTRTQDPVQAAKLAMRTLARRITALNTEIAEADQVITGLVQDLVPTLLAMRQIGPHTAAQFVITAGQNPDRITTEARFAKLTGVAPLPVSSGKRQHRHRLNRGGDRQANRALHLIVLGRLKDHEPTRAYYTRRRSEQLTDREIIRCLKRHLARNVYQALKTDLLTLDGP